MRYKEEDRDNKTHNLGVSRLAKQDQLRVGVYPVLDFPLYELSFDGILCTMGEFQKPIC